MVVIVILAILTKAGSSPPLSVGSEDIIKSLSGERALKRYAT
jgi:hypothetical protein